MKRESRESRVERFKSVEDVGRVRMKGTESYERKKLTKHLERCYRRCLGCQTLTDAQPAPAIVALNHRCQQTA